MVIYPGLQHIRGVLKSERATNWFGYDIRIHVDTGADPKVSPPCTKEHGNVEFDSLLPDDVTES